MIGEVVLDSTTGEVVWGCMIGEVGLESMKGAVVTELPTIEVVDSKSEDVELGSTAGDSVDNLVINTVVLDNISPGIVVPGKPGSTVDM